MQTHVTRRSLSQYAGIVDPLQLSELRRLAAPLVGMRLLHLSAGPFGSAVAETLAALVPLQRDLGITAHWRWVREPSGRGIWNRFYRGMAGEPVDWARRERRAWEASMAEVAGEGFSDYDAVIVHDPQLLGLPDACSRKGGQPMWIWHCHLDTQAAPPQVLEDAARHFDSYAVALFPTPDMIPPYQGLVCRGTARPAIDPLSPRSQPIAPSLRRVVLQQLGIDPTRPVIGQFAPIDARYAPVAALGAYWLVQRTVPGVQLVLADVSSVERNHPAPEEDRVLQMAGADPNIHVFPSGAGLGSTEIGVLQDVASIVLQMAVPRGFSWGLAESQWKGKPAIVGRFGLLPEQVAWGKAGLLVDGAHDAALGVAQLLEEPAMSAGLGARGRARLAERYLITGLLEDYLLMLRRLLVGELLPPSWGAAALGPLLDPATEPRASLTG